MKNPTIIIFILVLYGITIVNAQNMGINSVYMSPPNPTNKDSIYLITALTFPSGGCGVKEHTTTISPFYIHNISDYCLGNYAYVCTTYDTLKINPLVGGNYIYHYVVNKATYWGGCETYFPYDSIDVIFSVINSSDIVNSFDNITKINLYYSKFDNDLHIKINKYIGEYTIYINSIEGKELLKIKSKNLEQKIDLGFKSGIYLVTIVGNNIFETKKIFISH